MIHYFTKKYMKKSILMTFIALIAMTGYSQTVLNGDFEINSSSGCSFNNLNNTFNMKMSNCFAFGTGSEIDIQNSSCGYSNPASGNWFISLATRFIGSSAVTDQIALKISSLIVNGNSYQISFYQKANTSFAPLDSLIIGVSSDSSTFGTQIYSLQPQDQIGWTLTSFSFSVPLTARFITFGNKGLNRGWNYIDDIQMTITTGLNDNEHAQSLIFSPNPFSFETNLQTTQVLTDAIITIYNSLGLEIKQMQNISGRTIYLQRDNLSSGLYFIQVKQKNKILATEKIIITDN